MSLLFDTKYDDTLLSAFRNHAGPATLNSYGRTSVNKTNASPLLLSNDPIQYDNPTTNILHTTQQTSQTPELDTLDSNNDTIPV